MHDIVVNYCHQKEKGISLTDIATIIIAAVNLILAFYIFVYQRSKDKKVEANTALLNEQNIKLQWFKSLIIEPHYDTFIKTYKTLIEYNPNFVSPNEANYESVVDSYIKFVKDQVFPLSKSFIALFEVVNPKLHRDALDIIDNLIDSLSIKLIDNKIDVSNKDRYDEIILKEIISSKNKMITLVYAYKGIN